MFESFYPRPYFAALHYKKPNYNLDCLWQTICRTNPLHGQRHVYDCISNRINQVDSLAQGSSNSIANALELLQSCAKPSKWLTVGVFIEAQTEDKERMSVCCTCSHQLPPWGPDKMTTVVQMTTLVDLLEWFWLIFHWNLLPRAQTAICQHCFKQWATSCYLKQWLFGLLTHLGGCMIWSSRIKTQRLNLSEYFGFADCTMKKYPNGSLSWRFDLSQRRSLINFCLSNTYCTCIAFYTMLTHGAGNKSRLQNKVCRSRYIYIYDYKDKDKADVISYNVLLHATKWIADEGTSI